MKNKLSVLLIEDSEDDALLIKRELEKNGYNLQMERVETEEDMQKALKKKSWDLIISDYVLPRFSGLEALQLYKKEQLDLPFIVVSGKIGEDTAVEAMRAGATDYIMKNNLSRLSPAVKRELADYKIRQDRMKVKQELKESLSELEKVNSQLQNEIEVRKKAEEEAVDAKEHFQNIIESTHDLIISVDKNNRVSTWNMTAEDVTGYKRKEVLNRTITKVPVFKDPQRVLDVIKQVSEEKKSGFEDIVILTKNNAKKIIRLKATVLKGKSDQKIGVLFMGQDITKDMEMHGKLIDGKSYVFPDKNIDSTMNLFVDLIRSDYTGLCITRSNPENIKSMIPSRSKVNIVLLGQEKAGDYPNISDTKSLIQYIKEFTRKQEKSLILLDGVHYLITKFSFEEFLDALYQINEIVAKSHCLLFLRFDPAIVSEQQMAIIDNELDRVPSQKIEGIILEDSVYSMLKFIYEQNQNNALIPYKKVMAHFKIAYSTAAKRLEELESKGLIFTKRRGKLRTVYISDKGKTLLHKREIA
jgi:PAS domain S-box-containing protein